MYLPSGKKHSSSKVILFQNFAYSDFKFSVCQPLPLSSFYHSAKDYADSDPSGRSGLPITTIKQGAEPPTFTGWFQAWDPNMWEGDPMEKICSKY